MLPDMIVRAAAIAALAIFSAGCPQAGNQSEPGGYCWGSGYVTKCESTAPDACHDKARAHCPGGYNVVCDWTPNGKLLVACK
jgi:hypothetical protein